MSEAQAERILSYVQSLARDPDWLEVALYNAIVLLTQATHLIARYRTENREQRKMLDKARAAAAQKGRKGSTPNSAHAVVVQKMVAAMTADPPEDGRAWSNQQKAQFTKKFDWNLVSDWLATKGITFERPSKDTWRRWWKEAEKTYRAERLREEAEALDRLAPLMAELDELCALEPPQPGVTRVMDVFAEALAAARQRARRKG